MFRRTMHPLIGIVLFLGAFGIVYTLFEEPGVLFRRILFIGLLIVLLYAFYHFVYQRRMNKERAAYLKAVQQSKKLYVERDRKTLAKASHPKKGTHHRLPKKRSTTHLTVIEGKKGKKKNRASF